MNWLAPDGSATEIAAYCRTGTTDAAALLADAATACRCIDEMCGPVLLATATLRIRSARATVIAPYRVASVTSLLTDDGTTIPPSALDVEGYLITRVDGADVPAGVLSYTSGWAQAQIPRAIITAGLMVTRQLMRSRQGNQRAEGDGLPGLGVLVPRQAEQLLQPYLLPAMGFA